MMGLVALGFAPGLGAQILGAPPRLGEAQCRTASAEPAAVLERALGVMGVRTAGDRVLHFLSRESSAAREQSDRWYPPFLHAMTEREVWVDPVTGVERYESDMVWPGGGAGARSTLLLSSTAAYAVRGDETRPAPAGFFAFAARTRSLNPWTVVLEWRADPGVRSAGECLYRDYWRTALERDAVAGPERLLLDPKSGFPLLLEYDEPHYLWGQLHVGYLYATWIAPGGGGSYPGSAHRLEDGETVVSRTVQGGGIALMAPAAAPSLAVPAEAPAMRGPGGGSSSSIIASTAVELPDTVRVTENTWLLVTRAYTETVTLQNDTVYLLDATSSEARARGDSTRIAQLFPGSPPVTVVVTDLAWPHIAGVRFWVARGAGIVTHRASVGFLQAVTARRWTLNPDALERSAAPRGEDLRVRALTDSLSVAGGAVRVYPIDGAASEGALFVHLPGEGYLWASDFVQRMDEPSQYAREVWEAACRVGITPERFAAEHLQLTEWSALERLVGRSGARDVGGAERAPPDRAGREQIGRGPDSGP
jgi:hypothetical protein